MNLNIRYYGCFLSQRNIDVIMLWFIYCVLLMQCCIINISYAFEQQPDEYESLSKDLQSSNYEILFNSLIKVRNSDIARKYQPILIKLLSNDDSRIRELTAETLGEIGESSKECRESLEKNLKDKSASVRCSAALALWRIFNNTEITLNILTSELYSDEDSAWYAAYTIAEMGNSALPILKSLLHVYDIKSDSVRGRILIAVGKMGPNAITALPKITIVLKNEPNLSPNWCFAAIAFWKITKTNNIIIDGLINILNCKTNSLKRYASETIGDMGEKGEKAIPALVNLLADYDNYKHVQKALVEIGVKSLPYLLKEIGNKNPFVRKNAYQVMCSMANETNKYKNEIFGELKKENNCEVIRYGCLLLGKMKADDDDIIDYLLGLLNSRNEKDIANAADALCTIQPVKRDILKQIIIALDKNISSETKEEIVDSIGKLAWKGSAAVNKLVKMLRGENIKVKCSIVKTLGRIGKASKVAIPLLDEIIKLNENKKTFPEIILFNESVKAKHNIIKDNEIM